MPVATLSPSASSTTPSVVGILLQPYRHPSHFLKDSNEQPYVTCLPSPTRSWDHWLHIPASTWAILQEFGFILHCCILGQELSEISNSRCRRRGGCSVAWSCLSIRHIGEIGLQGCHQSSHYGLFHEAYHSSAVTVCRWWESNRLVCSIRFCLSGRTYQSVGCLIRRREALWNFDYKSVIKITHMLLPFSWSGQTAPLLQGYHWAISWLLP